MRPCRPAEELHDHPTERRAGRSRRVAPPATRTACSRPACRIAAAVSIIGLLVIAIVTLNLTNGKLPFTPGGGGGGGPQGTDQVPTRTRDAVERSSIVPTPPAVPGIEPCPGTLVYAKDGNIWIQSGDQATQLTAPGKGVDDSMPSFSPDGKSVYFVRTRKADGKWSIDNVVKDYQLNVPALMRINIADGSTRPPARRHRERARQLQMERVHPRAGCLARRPLRRDGDRPARPDASDVTLKLFDTKTDKINDLKLNQVAPLGHQDPAWKPDGSEARCTCSTTVTAPRARPGSTPGPRTPRRRGRSPGPGYLFPSWSPDGKYIAATKTSAYGTDVVILNAANGAELAAADRRRQQLGADVVAARGPGRVPARGGPGHRPAHGPARRHGAQLDRQGHARPDHRGRPRRRVAPRLVRAGRPTCRPRARPSATRPRLRDLVPRPARRADRGDGLGPVRGHRPRPGGAAGRIPGDGRRRGALRAAARRGDAPVRDGGEAQPRVLRGARLRGDRRARAAACRCPGRRAVHRRREAGRHRFDGRPAGGGAVRRARGRRRHRQPVPRRGGDRAAARARGPVRLRAVPDLEPRARRSSRRSRWPPDAPRPGPPSRCGRASRVARRAGARAAPSASWSARPPPPSSRAIRELAPGLAFLVPGVGAQGGEVEPVLAAGPARAAPAGGRAGRRPARQRVPRASPGRRWRPPPRGRRRTLASASRRPPPSGPNGSLCYPDALPGRPEPARSITRSIHEMPFNIGPGELIIVLIIALIVVGPGKLPDVGAALGKSIKEFRKAATDVKDATSLEDPAPAAVPRPPQPRRRPPRTRSRPRPRRTRSPPRRPTRSPPRPSPVAPVAPSPRPSPAAPAAAEPAARPRRRTSRPRPRPRRTAARSSHG